MEFGKKQTKQFSLCGRWQLWVLKIMFSATDYGLKHHIFVILLIKTTCFLLVTSFVFVATSKHRGFVFIPLSLSLILFLILAFFPV